MRITSQFDGGNIICKESSDPNNIQLEIRKDHQSDFYQWFYFRLSDAFNKNCQLHISNAKNSAYPDGWQNYRVVASYDRQQWFRIPTQYDGNTLSFSINPEKDSVYFAYFAPYPFEKHNDLVAKIACRPGVKSTNLGPTIDGRPLDMLQIGSARSDKKNYWLIARQHPGETMAEWWMEGFLERLTDSDDPVTRNLLNEGVFYVVPNMNPDGSFRGHLRTNAIGTNLNREWNAPSLEKSPEVYYVLEKMKSTGVDFCLDVHGDEALPYNFIAGAEGVPSWSDQRQQQLTQFKETFASLTPDFQTQHGYPVDQPGQANLSICTNAIAEKFGALAMTLEMPFKDTADTPCETEGWSPNRCRLLGRSCIDVINSTKAWL